MKDLVENIWIINREGICYFYRKVDKNSTMNEQSFTNFISAMMNFTKDLFKDEFNKLTLGAMDIYLHSFKLFQIVVTSKKGTKDKEVLKLIDKIGKGFNEKFSNQLGNNFTGDSFKDFNTDLDFIMN